MPMSVHSLPKYINHVYNSILNKVHVVGFVQKHP